MTAIAVIETHVSRSFSTSHPRITATTGFTYE